MVSWGRPFKNSATFRSEGDTYSPNQYKYLRSVKSLSRIMSLAKDREGSNCSRIR